MEGVSDSFPTCPGVKVFRVFSNKELLSTCDVEPTLVAWGAKEILNEYKKVGEVLSECVLLKWTNASNSWELAKRSYK